MTIGPIPRDDAGLHRLQESNAARAAGAVAPVTAAPAIGERPAEPVPLVGGSTGQTSKNNRRRNDRRRRQRRWARRAVLLDTRARHERRHGERRGSGADASSAPSRARPAWGVDVLA